jgi:hypothetical protein
MSPIHAKEVLSSKFEKKLVATVENLSHSGILLNGPQQLSEHTLVEMVLEMPERTSGQKNRRVLCQGRIIRHTEVCESEFMGMAASILDYKILPPKSGKGTW